ncbi:MAG TPA: hypothetical protein VF442_06115, partial [Sphingobium sp.]
MTAGQFSPRSTIKAAIPAESRLGKEEMAQQTKPAADHRAVDEPITRAIRAAETRSAAEIAVAILPRADRYTLTAVLAALLLFAILHAVLGWVDLNALLLPTTPGSGAWL